MCVIKNKNNQESNVTIQQNYFYGCLFVVIVRFFFGFRILCHWCSFYVCSVFALKILNTFLWFVSKWWTMEAGVVVLNVARFALQLRILISDLWLI